MAQGVTGADGPPTADSVAARAAADADGTTTTTAPTVAALAVTDVATEVSLATVTAAMHICVRVRRWFAVVVSTRRIIFLALVAIIEKVRSVIKLSGIAFKTQNI